MSLWDKDEFKANKEGEDVNVLEEDSEEDEEKKYILSSKPQNENEENNEEEEEKSAESEEEEEKKYNPKKLTKKLNKERHEKEADKTVFIANVSVNTKTAEMKKFLKQFGKLESFRFRSACYGTLDNSKKVEFLSKDYNSRRKTQCVYAVFENEETAKNAAEKIDNQVFKEYHLRADWEKNKDLKKDTRKTIFVGNLPYSLLMIIRMNYMLTIIRYRGGSSKTRI